LNLDPAGAIDLQLKTREGAQGSLTLHISVRGSGRHEIELRTGNADLPNKRLSFDLGTGGNKTTELAMSVPEHDRAWIVVAVPDGNLKEAVELFGATLPLAKVGEMREKI
jgi:hypothetical protein